MSVSLSLTIEQIDHLVRRYQADAVEDPQVVRALRRARAELASFWLSADPAALPQAWHGPPGRAQQLIVNSGLRDEFSAEEAEDAEDAEDERQVAAVAAAPLDWRDPSAVNRLLAAMPYVYAFAMRHDELDLPRVPPWLAEDYLRYLLKSPPTFLRIGDCDANAHHIRRVIAYLHQKIFAHPDEPLWLRAASIAAQRMQIVPLYFTDADLSDVLRQRGDLLDFVMRRAGHPIDHAFAPRPPGRRIRIGVLNDRWEADSGPFATLGTFRHLDRARFEVILYLSRPSDSAAERYCRSLADRVVVLTEKLDAVVRDIRRDDLDLLMWAPNLAGSTHLWVKAALHRLARVHFTNFGSPATTGLPTMDFFISGTLSEPAGASARYRESLELLEGTGFCIDTSPAASAAEAPAYYNLPADDARPPLDRAGLGVAPGAVLFASGANYFKLIPELLDAWLRVLAAVPGSELVLYPFGLAWSEAYPARTFRKRVRRMLERRKLAPDRVIVTPTLAGRHAVQELLRAAAVDVYLDSFPHSGSHSLFDALELGIPAATLLGRTLRGRHGAAMLLEMGVDDLVAADVEQYVALAARLATDAAWRPAMRDRILNALARRPRFRDPHWHAAQLAPRYEQWLAAWDARHPPHGH